MKHLEPGQPNPITNKRRQKKHQTLFWLTSVVVICLGLGATGSALFAPAEQDHVSDQEKQDRQIAFTKITELHLPAVEPEKMDMALSEMRLRPPDRAQMRALLEPVANTTPATASVAVPREKPALNLVSVSVWDTHAADGDVVALVSGGYRREIVLSKTVQTFIFPVDRKAMLHIVGVHDGGGGITLGISGPSQEILMPIISEGQTLSLPIAR